MAIQPKTTREHIISLYGYITGFGKSTRYKRNNFLIVNLSLQIIDTIYKA
jgi:hypothetical protein